jgi:hypothetical protein
VALQQRPPSSIIRINFPPRGGLVYFYYEYSYAGTTQLSSPYDIEFDFSHSDLRMSNFRIFRDTPIRIIPSDLSDAERRTVVPVVNPINANMLKHYAVFSARDTIDESKTVPGSTSVVYIIDGASWQLIYDHVLTARIIGNNYTRDQAIATWKTIVAREGNDPTLVGVQLAQIFYNGQFQDVPNFPDPLAFQAFAENGWTYHTEPSTGPTSYSRKGKGYVVFNLSLLRNFLPSNKKTVASVSFLINFIEANTNIGTTKLKAQAWLTGQRWDFPVDSNGVPTFFTDAQIVNLLRPSTTKFADAKITFLGKDPRGNTTPPTVNLFSTGTEGGGGPIV